MAFNTSVNFCQLISVLLLTLILISTALNNQKQSCARRSPDLFGKKCCQNEAFSYDHLEKFYKACNVPPKNQSLSLAESHWKFFECLLTKSLDKKPLTLTNFAEVMTTNMSDRVRQAILSSLKNSKDQDVDSTEMTPKLLEEKSEIVKINFLKTLWTTYFDTEFEVCLGEDLLVANMTAEEVQWFRGSWNPSSNCGYTMYPSVNSIFHGEKMQHCQKSFKQRYTNGNLTFLVQNCMEDVCRQLFFETVTETELRRSIDFELKLKSFIPGFLSKSLTDLVETEVPKVLNRRVDRNTNDTLAKAIQKTYHMAESWFNSTSIKAELGDMCVNAKTVNDLFNAVSRVGWQLCSLSAT